MNLNESAVTELGLIALSHSRAKTCCTPWCSFASPLIFSINMAVEVETALRARITKLFDEIKCMPMMVRLAWHDAGTYNVKDKTGGANGSIRLEPEVDHGANAGLKMGMNLLEPIHAEFPSVSYADLYQLASVVGIEYAGGPKIPFRFGRKDAETTTEDGRLPDATKRMPHLRDIFYRMGLNDKEIVILSGAHCLGAAHKDRSGFEGKWTTDPNKFDNSYYHTILASDANGLLRLDSDMALLDEPECEKLVRAYAEDEKLFFDDYTAAHVKLSELGMA